MQATRQRHRREALRAGGSRLGRCVCCHFSPCSSKRRRCRLQGLTRQSVCPGRRPVAALQQGVACGAATRRRRSTEGSLSSWRYLVTVRRATFRPWRTSSRAICASDSGVGRVLRLDHALDDAADRRRRAGAAARRRHLAREEVLELEHADRRRHVLVVGDPGDRRLVQAELLGDLAQAERLHRHRAELEEVLLALEDRLGDHQDGREALLHVLHRPARFLQVLRRARCSCRCGAAGTGPRRSG